MSEFGPDYATYDNQLLLSGVPEDLEAFEYSLSFDWGNVLVSQAAEAAYNLTPLIEKKKGEVHKAPEKFTPLVEIWLLAPTEYMPKAPRVLEHPYRAEKPELTPLHKTILHRRGIGLVVAFDKDRETLYEEFTDDIETRMGVDRDDFDKKISLRMGGTEMPHEQIASQHITQSMVHSVSGLIFDTMPEAVVQWQHAINRETYWKNYKLCAAGALAIGAGSVTLSLLLGGATPEGIAGSETLYWSSVLGLGGYSIKKHFNTADQRESLIVAKALKLTDTVAESFHNAYCTKEFDE